MSKENSIVITSAVRTAIGDLGGSLKNVPGGLEAHDTKKITTV